MNVLVTGGAGYVGSTLVPMLLEAGHRVRVLDSLQHGGASLLGVWANPQFEFVKGDVRDAAAVRSAIAGMDAVTNSQRGTAYGARIVDPEMAMAGKTGTAQVKRITQADRDAGPKKTADIPWNLRHHALFVAFAPVGNPRYACAVVIEHGGHTNPQFDAPIVTANVLRQTFLRDPANRAAARLAALEPPVRQA